MQVRAPYKTIIEDAAAALAGRVGTEGAVDDLRVRATKLTVVPDSAASSSASRVAAEGAVDDLQVRAAKRIESAAEDTAAPAVAHRGRRVAAQVTVADG